MKAFNGTPHSNGGRISTSRAVKDTPNSKRKAPAENGQPDLELAEAWDRHIQLFSPILLIIICGKNRFTIAAKYVGRVTI